MILLAPMGLVASGAKVLVYPQNREISQMIKTFLSSELEIVETKNQDYPLDPIIENDFYFIDFILKNEGCDFIIVPRITNISGFIHQEIFVVSKDQNKKIFDNLVKDSSLFPIQSALALVNEYLGPQYSLLEIEDLVPGTEVQSYENHILLEKGEHEIVLSCTGYEDQVLNINIEEENVIYKTKASQKRLYCESLNISSNVVANVFLEGKMVGQTPLTLNNIALPFTLSLEREGYSSKNIDISKSLENISVDLRPEYLSSNTLFEEYKKDFYSDFARTLVLFGAKIALSAFEGSANDFLKASDMTLNAAISISIVEIFYSLFDYYRQSMYITP